MPLTSRPSEQPMRLSLLSIRDKKCSLSKSQSFLNYIYYEYIYNKDKILIKESLVNLYNNKEIKINLVYEYGFY